MHRIRMSLPYFKQCGWEAELVAVDPKYSNTLKDELLMESIPPNTKIHYVNALDQKWTSKIGLGSLALRSIWFYWKKVNQLLLKEKFDLIYFSTTQFPICILGAYWKNRFKVPYVIDMQDPWHSDYYQNKPKTQQPPKYWFSYRLNKWLEPIAITHVDGLISVSGDYIETLKVRYPQIKAIPSSIITFGAFQEDLEIAKNNQHLFTSLLQKNTINVVYVGRGGYDMHDAIKPLFQALKNGIEENHLNFEKIRLYFIGTSYAQAGQGEATISPLAKQYGIEPYVIEITDRISFYHTLLTLKNADALFIPGSDDPKYTASKIYPYLTTQKNMLVILNKDSPAVQVLQEYDVKHIYSYDEPNLTNKIHTFFSEVTGKQSPEIKYNKEAINKYSAMNMTYRQCLLFNTVVNKE